MLEIQQQAQGRRGEAAVTDGEWIAGSLADADQFAVVFDRHWGEMHRYVVRRLGVAAAEDVTAEVFLRAFRLRERYQPERADARLWLYGIASKLIAEHRCAERRQLRLLASTVPGESAASFEERSDDKVAATELRPRLAALLGRLKKADRDLLLLIAWGDLTNAEAAEVLGIPESTARSRLARLRQKLRQALDNEPRTADEEE